ncbi:hypothetical protein BDZ88DRAFT_482491 [Geranomyces variabilis]|nr:hypothetical protein BDZ88DRAFT_482491 [Geranomyces variabilis]
MFLVASTQLTTFLPSRILQSQDSKVGTTPCKAGKGFPCQRLQHFYGLNALAIRPNMATISNLELGTQRQTARCTPPFLCAAESEGYSHANEGAAFLQHVQVSLEVWELGRAIQKLHVSVPQELRRKDASDDTTPSKSYANSQTSPSQPSPPLPHSLPRPTHRGCCRRHRRHRGTPVDTVQSSHAVHCDILSNVVDLREDLSTRAEQGAFSPADLIAATDKIVAAIEAAIRASTCEIIAAVNASNKHNIAAIDDLCKRQNIQWAMANASISSFPCLRWLGKPNFVKPSKVQ